MIKEFEIGMNALSPEYLMYEWNTTDKEGYLEHIPVTAEVEQQYYRGDKNCLSITLLTIGGKDIVSIDQTFEDEIKNKIVRELE